MSERYEPITIRPHAIACVCADCGSVVWNQGKHDQWHDDISRIAVTAIEADSWAGMNRPLG